MDEDEDIRYGHLIKMYNKLFEYCGQLDEELEYCKISISDMASAMDEKFTSIQNLFKILEAKGAFK